MDRWIDRYEFQDHPFVMLSNPNYDEIITLDSQIFQPQSMRDIALHYIRDMVVNSKCQLCCIISLCLPKQVERDLMKLIPGDYWVSH